MFSKKVQEHDDAKQEISIKEKELGTICLQVDGLQDYKVKYSRETKTNEELAEKYIKVNEDLEKRA